MREWILSSVETGGDVNIVVWMVGSVGLEHWKSCLSCLGCRFCRCCWSLFSQPAITHSAWQGCRCLNNIVHFIILLAFNCYVKRIAHQLLAYLILLIEWCACFFIQRGPGSSTDIRLVQREKKSANYFEAPSEGRFLPLSHLVRIIPIRLKTPSLVFITNGPICITGSL